MFWVLKWKKYILLTCQKEFKSLFLKCFNVLMFLSKIYSFNDSKRNGQKRSKILAMRAKSKGREIKSKR